MVDKQIIHAVDQLLSDQGVYIPLELLLAEGRLLYADYESWRSGGFGYLEELLFGDPQEIGRMLEEAARYAEAQGLEVEPHQYHPWSGEVRPLKYSSSSTRDSLFQMRYVKAEERHQLDLFLDNDGNTQLNEVIGALCDRDSKRARVALERLYDADPGNARLGMLERLVTGLEQILGVPEYADDQLEGVLDTLENEILPMATELLGGAGRDYLVLFWQRLLDSLEGRDFDPENARLHASYCAMRMEDWRQACESIECQTDWSGQPELLYRHALVSHRLREEPVFLKDWFNLCAISPELAEHLVKQLSVEWQALWNDFLDAEPELEVADFPAWLLIQRPLLADRISYDREEESGLSQAMHVILLLGRQGTGLGEEAIALRKRLQQASPSLFEHLLAS